MKSDIEISYEYANKYKDITKIAKKLGIKSKYIEPYGNNKFAKINLDANNNKKQGKLILVTAISPTKAGEGKTTVAIGLADSLNKIGKKTALALREPSMGPVFGIKGGATGGGYAQVYPMEDINLHFTGDMHAITAANNLIAACIDNHIYYGNNLDIQKVIFERCLDINDRQLRNITLNNSRIDHFNLTVASEIMAILCLSKDIEDLRERIKNIIIGYTSKNVPVFVQDLNIQDSVVMLLKDAIKPNLAQTLYRTPAFIHGGPFANIAHGCNSIIATKIAMNYADYTVTEGGFGADLGAQKFLDIVCPNAEIYPDCVVLVASVRALKLHGGEKYENLGLKNIDALEKGLNNNLLVHMNNLTNNYKVPVIIAINEFNTDYKDELDILEDFCRQHHFIYSFVRSFTDGNKGSINLAKLIIKEIKLYSKIKEDNLWLTIPQHHGKTIREKIEWLCQNIYHANNIVYENSTLDKIDQLEKIFYKDLNSKNYYVCIAKTPYALNDGNEDKNTFTITDIDIHNGAQFIIIKAGKIMTMPGLPAKPLASKIKFNNNIITGMI